MNANVHIFNNVLINHKVAKLREISTTTKEFRELIEEIAMLMSFEAFKDLPTQSVVVNTPHGAIEQNVLKDNCVTILPILRAGLGMVSGVLALIPTAQVGHIGMYRDEKTLQPCEYYCKLPEGIKNSVAVILDPMLATGGSANMAIDYLKSQGVEHIKLISVLGAPEGLSNVMTAHPEVQIYLAKLDDGLSEHGYIIPGLGDAGDRIFGTK